MTKDQYDALRQKIEQPLSGEGHTLKALPQWQPSQWMATLDERMNKHVAFARDYAKHYAHGAPGHLDLMTIAALANALDNYANYGDPWPRPGVQE